MKEKMMCHRLVGPGGRSVPRRICISAGITAVLLLTIVSLPADHLRAEEPDPVKQTGNDSSRDNEGAGQCDTETIRLLLQRIEELERRLKALEGKQDDELAELLAEAEALTSEERAREREAETKRESFTGRQRTLQALNPEISFLGDISYDWTEDAMKDGFHIRGVELALRAPLDPYTRFKAFLAGHQEPFTLDLADHGEVPESGHDHGDTVNMHVEEAYMEWVALPLNSSLRIGRFRQRFGTLNRWHPHSLQTVDIPFAIRNLFGHDGLAGLGIGIDMQLPPLWATSNGVTIEVVNADNPHSFAGSHWRDPAYLLRHTGFFEFGDDTYFEVGLNGAWGKNDEAGDHDTAVTGIDLNFLWEPVNRSKYRNMEIRGEYFRSSFESEEAGKIRSDSFYLLFSTRLTRRWITGIRYDHTELPSDRFELYDPLTLEEMPFTTGLKEKAWSPFLTYWQSEFVRLRLQYQHADRDYTTSWGESDDDRLWLQVTFAAGPHKHESY